MEEKLDLIIQKLDTITERLDKALALIERIHKDTEPSIENNASEYLLNVFGDTESPKFWLNIPTHRINKDITPGNVVETT